MSMISYDDHHQSHKTYDKLFPMIPGMMIFDLIIQPFLSLQDVAVLEVAMTNKCMRADFHHSINIINHNQKSLRSRSLSSIPPFIEGATWLCQYEETSEETILKSTIISWLKLRSIQLSSIFMYQISHTSDYYNIRYCRNLRKLTVYILNADEQVTAYHQILKDVVPYFKYLEEIDSMNIDMSTISLLSKYCPNLTSIDGRGKTDSELILSDIIKLIPQLRHLKLGAQYNDVHIESIYLTILSFAYNGGDLVTSENLIKLSQSFPNLTYFHISNAIIPLAAVQDLQAYYPHLLPLFAKVKKMKHSNIIEGDGLPMLMGMMPQLTNLHIVTHKHDDTPAYQQFATNILESCKYLTDITYYDGLSESPLTRVIGNNNFITLLFTKPSLRRVELANVIFPLELKLSEPVYLEKLTLFRCELNVNVYTHKCLVDDVHLQNVEAVINHIQNLRQQPTLSAGHNNMRVLVSSMVRKGAMLTLHGSHGLSQEFIEELKRDHPHVRIV